jgi:cellobiose-specific phosphotransferase system component IIB
LLKYENLTKNPENTILNLANSLNIEINDEKIKEVIKKYMFKDVWLFGKPSDDFKHFNKAQNSWREYFPPTMQKLICDEIGDLLIELGYEKDKNWACDNKNLTKEQNCIEKAYKDNMFLSLEVFIDHINELLQNKRVAFYGAGEYFSLIVNKITNIDRAIFVIDGNKSKYGQKICGVEVVSEDDIALRFDEFDVVLTCVAPQYQDNVNQKLKTLKIANQNIYNIFNILIYDKLKQI